ncbi:MAG TPA: TraB/GumN family protein [Sphingomicrobium sp.]|nr:TraB/GumN family protein [Sphingomicrobium sp.]
MAQPGTVFVAVGAGHLAGPYSVLALLQRDRYRVKRLQ